MKELTPAKFLKRKKNAKFKFYIDSMNKTNFENTYYGWPERGFVFYKGRIKHISYGRIEDATNRWKEEIEDWMEKNQKLIK